MNLFDLIFFLTKYTVTHEQVIRSAPTREPDDIQNSSVDTRENKLSMSQHSQLRNEANLKNLEDGGEPAGSYVRQSSSVLSGYEWPGGVPDAGRSDARWCLPLVGSLALAR